MPMKKETLLRALTILAGHPHGCELRMFAKSMWPESKSWRKPAKMPNAASPTGAVMNTAAAAFLGRMRKARLVDRAGGRYRASAMGVEFLRNKGEAPKASPPTTWVRDAWGNPVQLFWDGAQWVRWDGRGWVRW